MKILMNKVHGGWEYEFSKIGYDIIRLSDSERYKWNINDCKRPCPQNIKSFHLNDHLDLIDQCDIIIINQIEFCEMFKDVKKPKIFIPHTIRNTIGFHEYKEYYDIVHTCKYTRDMSSCDGPVIYNGVSIDNYKTYDFKKSYYGIAGSFNNMIGRKEIGGYDLWMKLTYGRNSILYGHNNEQINQKSNTYLGIEDYANELIKHRIFLNTTESSILPMALYDAMASGMPIITTNTCGISEVIEHDMNGLISNNPDELAYYIDMLMNDEDECSRLGKNAKNSALNYFNSNRMAVEWKALIESKI